MRRSCTRFAWTCALTALLLSGESARALTFEWEDLPNQGPSDGITLVSGGVTAEAMAFGGLTNPQDIITPDAAPGATNIQVNIGGLFPDSDLFGLRGLGCGIAQCDLIAPLGEDAVRISFSESVTLDTLILSAMEGPDDVSWWYWDDSAWVFAGQDDCSGISCSGQETFGGPFGTSHHWLFVAENTGASAFRIAEMQVTPEPPPPPVATPVPRATGPVLAGLLGAVGARGTRRGTARERRLRPRGAPGIPSRGA